MTSLNKYLMVLFFILYYGDVMTISFDNIDKNGVIIDIRNSNYFKEKNIPSSINIPKLNLLGNPNKYLNKRDTYYLVCDSGNVSLYTSKVLNSLGYRCYSIEGGIEKIL